ncbi:MAG: iron complex transport system substrate-binding protein [Euryarchaeota archaeon]|nr:iron complex transport system substrate-binding protein [Euryarchaeota archaeon]
MRPNRLILILIYALVVLSPTNAADFVLEIYGNANMDECLNQDDLDYIRDIVAGKNEPTKLADANFDGLVNEEDIEQLQAILDGREEMLTFIDMLGEPVTVNKPIRRLVNMGYNGVEMTRILGAEDILVAYGQDRTEHAAFFPKFAELPFVGSDHNECDYEKIISLKPDAVQTNIERASFTVGGLDQKRIFEKNLKDTPLICLNMREQDTLVQNVRTYGYILDREREAEEFIDWYSGYYDLFLSRTESLSGDEKPRCVFEYTPYYCYASGSNLGQVLTLAGGKNILDEKIGPDDPKYGSMLDIEPEFVVKENPEYIFKAVGSWESGYHIENASAMAAYQEQVTNRTELANIIAVREDNVHCMSYWILIGAGNNIIGTAYVAKLLHPDLFQDIDPVAIHQEYVDRFCRIDFNVEEKGAFLYPPYGSWAVEA